MKSLVLCLCVLAGCAPVSPEQRAYTLGVLRQQQAQDAAYARQHAYLSSQALHGPFRRQPAYQPPPSSYRVRRDHYGSGYLVTPEPYGY